jgi:hypothetical protein
LVSFRQEFELEPPPPDELLELLLSATATSQERLERAHGAAHKNDSADAHDVAAIHKFCHRTPLWGFLQEETDAGPPRFWQQKSRVKNAAQLADERRALHCGDEVDLANYAAMKSPQIMNES